MELKCLRCKKIWNYKGSIKPKDYPQYTCCPRCKTSVKIQNETIDSKKLNE